MHTNTQSRNFAASCRDWLIEDL